MTPINTTALVQPSGRARAVEAQWRAQCAARAPLPRPELRVATGLLDGLLVVLGAVVLIAVLSLAGMWYSAHVAERRAAAIDQPCERFIRAIARDGTVIDEACLP